MLIPITFPGQTGPGHMLGSGSEKGAGHGKEETHDRENYPVFTNG